MHVKLGKDGNQDFGAHPREHWAAGSILTFRWTHFPGCYQCTHAIYGISHISNSHQLNIAHATAACCLWVLRVLNTLQTDYRHDILVLLIVTSGDLFNFKGK